jgi:phenylacetate-CoA ligase
MRRRIELLLGIESFDLDALTELWGPGTGVECHRHDGIHCWSDHYLVEIVDPDTREPVAPGQTGEIALTTFGKEATPLVRYRTRDVSHLIIEPCACGSPHPRIARLVGRSRDLVKVRGVVVYLAQMDIAIAAVDGVECEYQLHISGDERGHEQIILRVEGDRIPHVADALTEALRRVVGLRIDVDIVAVRSVPRA